MGPYLSKASDVIVGSRRTLESPECLGAPVCRSATAYPLSQVGVLGAKLAESREVNDTSYRRIQPTRRLLKERLSSVVRAPAQGAGRVPLGTRFSGLNCRISSQEAVEEHMKCIVAP